MMQACVRLHPIEERIDHGLAFVEVDTFVLQISFQNFQLFRILACDQPVQIQTAAFAGESRLVGRTVIQFSAQVWRPRIDCRMQRHFGAGTRDSFRFEHPSAVAGN